ncbi:MAG: hypothetical protein RMJ33_06100 [Saprospiraceae bacterium]|nr:hypothetical protein [Saprospiraceae bacterium]MDW8229391.1 hypothetical protein [Saprospiraceae bacterium]
MTAFFTQWPACAALCVAGTFASFAQTPSVTTNIPTDLSACEEAVFSIEVANPGNQPLAAGTLQYCLTSGLTFAGATGIAVSDSADARCPVLTLPALAPQGKLTFSLRVRVGCFAVDVGDRRDTIRITSGGMPQPLVLGSAYNVRTPLITLTPGSNWSFAGSNGTVFTRTFTLRNEGVGNAYRVFVIDPYKTAGLELVQTTGAFSGDTLLLTGSHLGTKGFLAFRDSVVVTQTFRLRSCTTAGTTVAYGWSCSGAPPCAVLRFQQYETRSDTASPTVVEVRLGRPFKTPQPCQQDSVVLKIENKGQAPAFSIECVLGVAPMFSLSAEESVKDDACYPMTQFRVGNALLADASAGSPSEPFRFLFSTLTTDPDGPGGLSDEDGDGQFDDLAPGATASLAFLFAINPSCKQCNQLFVQQFIIADVHFTDACKQPQTSFLQSPPNIGIGFDKSDLDIEHDFILFADSVYTFSYVLDATFFGLSQICPNDSIIAQFTLPITLKRPSAFFPEMDGQPLPWWQPNDTTINLRLPHERGNLSLPLLVVCPPDIDNSAICTPSYEPRTYRMPLRIYWRCGNGCPQTYELICIGGPFFTVDCPRPKDTSQQHGIFADTFFVQRLSLGYVDNLLSARVSPQPGLQLDIALPFDTVLMQGRGRIEGFPGEAFDSAKVEIYYWNGVEPYFQHLNTRILFDDFETGASVNCTNLSPAYRYVDGYHVWAFDLLPLSQPGGCLAAAGVRPTVGDRIRVEVLSVMRQLLPSDVARFVNDLRIRFPYRYGGDTLLCETFNAAFRCINPYYEVSMFAFLKDGVCGQLSVDVALIQGISDDVDNDLFPGEIRPLFVYDTLTIAVLPGYAYVPGSSQWFYRQGDGAQGLPPFASQPLADPEIIPLFDGSALLRYVRPAKLPVTDYYIGGAFSTLSLLLEVNCPADTPVFPVRIVGNSYYSLYDTISVFYFGAFGHFEDLNETRLTTDHPVSNLRTPTWSVRLCNPSDGIEIPEPMVFFENNSDLPLLSVQHVTPFFDTLALTIEAGPNGQRFVRLPALSQNQCIELRIRAATPPDCQPDTLRLRAGFQCAGQSEPCFLKNELELYFRSQDAVPQVIASGPPLPVDLCSPASYEVYLVNQGEGPMYDISVLVRLPEIGQTYVPGSLSVVYDTIAVALPDPQITPEGLRITLNLAQLPLFIEALPGLAAAPKNALVFRFQVRANCDYIDAARIRYGAAWQNACVGAEKSVGPFAAPKMNILGAPTESNNYAVTIAAPVPFAYCGRIPLRVSIVNPGNLGPTRANEKVRLMLPESFQYVTGSLQPIHNGPTAGPVVLTADGQRFLVFGLPAGVQAGDSIVFLLEVRNTAPLTACTEIYAIAAQMLQTVDLPCGPLRCPVDFAMLEFDASLVLEKPTYQLVGLEGVSIPANANLENWQMEVRILNASAVAGGGALTLQVRLDADRNGQLDPTDPLLRSFNVPTDGLFPGVAQAFDFTVDVSAAQSCSGLWVVLADSACACQPDAVYVPFVPLRNTGQDLTLCAGQTVSLGGPPLAGATYSWSPASASLSNAAIANPTYRYTGPFDASLQRQEQLLLQTTRAQGCTSFDTVLITVRKVEATLAMSPVLCAGDSTGALAASVQGALPPVQYRWSPGASSDSLLLQLPAGTYRLIVIDSLGCADTVAAIVTEPAPLGLQLTAADYNGFGVSCAGATDGAISAAATGGVLPYTYEWLPFGSGPNPTNLPPGTYALTLTDANNCTTEAVVELTEPLPLQLSLTPQDERCAGAANGSIAVSISGGAGPYRVNNRPPGGALQTLSGLSGGAYTVVVTDANGCSASADTALQTLTSQVSVRSDSAACFGGNGRAEVVASGYPPFTYQWSNNTGAPSITAPAGAYAVTVSDALGCTYVLQTTIAQPPALTGQALAQPVRCFGEANGRIELTAQGGTPPYQFDRGGQPVSTPLTGLTPGVYTLRLTDAKGCTVLLSATITQPAPLLATVSTTDVRCFGERTGQAAAQPTGGTPPYVYAWSNGSAAATAQNLAAGTYTLTLTDANGCTLSVSATVREPAPYEPAFVVERQPCADRANGILAVSGFPPGTRYGLNRPPNTDAPRFSGVGGGPLTLNVIDSAGCRFAYDFSMPALPALLGQAFSDTTIRLGDSAWLRVEVSPAAVAASLVRFQWLNPAAVLSGCDTCPTLWVRPLRTTPYVVEFTTENGCRSESRILVSVVRDSVYAPNVIQGEASLVENQRFTLYARPGALREIRLLCVFDRWGSLVFEQRAFAPNNPSEGWDGRYRGQLLSPGVYVWYAEVEYFDGVVELLRGDVTLIR